MAQAYNLAHAEALAKGSVVDTEVEKRTLEIFESLTRMQRLLDAE